MVEGIIIIAVVIFLVLIFSFASAAKKADQDMERILHHEAENDIGESR